MDTLAQRIQSGVRRGPQFYIEVDGEQVVAYPGETIATVLLASGRHVFRSAQVSGAPRGMYCGMGLCYDCMVTLNGIENVRACRTEAHPGDKVERELK